MKFVAYTSKVWIFLLMALISAFGYVASFFWNEFPTLGKIIFCLFLGFVFILLLLQIASSEPTIVADENGLTCYKNFYRKIDWSDIKDAIRIPRAESYIARGRRYTNWSFCDAWRPIDIYVSDIDKYLRIIPPNINKFIFRYHNQGLHKDCFRLRIELAGTNGSSENLQEVIAYYLSQKSNQTEQGAAANP